MNYYNLYCDIKGGYENIIQSLEYKWVILLKSLSDRSNLIFYTIDLLIK